MNWHPANQITPRIIITCTYSITHAYSIPYYMRITSWQSEVHTKRPATKYTQSVLLQSTHKASCCKAGQGCAITSRGWSLLMCPLYHVHYHRCAQLCTQPLSIRSSRYDRSLRHGRTPYPTGNILYYLGQSIHCCEVLPYTTQWYHMLPKHVR
jgi:hypothetical protein